MPATSPAVAADDRELVITRVFSAPRDLVWKMWTDPEHAKHWWGPTHHPAVTMTMDPRPGGHWRHCLRSVETGEDLWHHGVFREVVPPERLVFTFSWEVEGERGVENVVTVTFTAQGDKTLMVFRHAPFLSVGERDGHNGGWTSTFDRFDAYLAAERGSS